MSKFIGAMRATHLEQPKLASIINEMNRYDMHLTLPTARETRLLEMVADRYDILLLANSNDYSVVKHIYEEKFDGFSYLADDGKLQSRSLSSAKGSEGQVIDKSDRVPHVAKAMEHLSVALGGLNTHGELFLPGGTSDDVNTIMACEPQKAVDRQMNGVPLSYLMYDVRSINGRYVATEPWYVRRAILEYVYSKVIELGYQNVIKISDVGTYRPDLAFSSIVRRGGEGIMIKSTNGLYMPNKKPAGNWIKCKKEYTADVIIMGFNEGTGKNADMFGSIKFGMMVNGKLQYVGSASGITDEFRALVANNPDAYIGMVMEIKAMEPNKKKVSFRSPRFKQLRHDKHPSECTMDNIRPIEELL